MRKSTLILVIIMILMVPASIGARSLLDISLGFGATYTPVETGDLSLGFRNPDNWMFSGELGIRFAFVQGQAMVFPVTCNDDAQGVLLIGMGSVSLPVLGSVLALEFGAGPSVTYMPTSSESSRAFYELADGQKADADEKSFAEAMWESPVYFQIGFGSEIGPVGIKLRYLMESEATLDSVFNARQWWDLFTVDKASLSLALALKMF
ncbi:MAG: hypothetical protein ACQ5SW_01645 [Sphaerochaetaceae bacterium]